jgi:glycopeptide antibiotics resistance protein
MRILEVLHRIGLPGWVNYGFVEAGSNVLMFVPLGALIALYFMRSLWWVSAVLGLTLSLCVEFGQEVLLPRRFASAGDLAANTAGALIGGAIVAVARRGTPEGRSGQLRQ